MYTPTGHEHSSRLHISAALLKKRQTGAGTAQGAGVAMICKDEVGDPKDFQNRAMPA